MSSFFLSLFLSTLLTIPNFIFLFFSLSSWILESIAELWWQFGLPIYFLWPIQKWATENSREGQKNLSKAHFSLEKSLRGQSSPPSSWSCSRPRLGRRGRSGSGRGRRAAGWARGTRSPGAGTASMKRSAWIRTQVQALKLHISIPDVKQYKISVTTPMKFFFNAFFLISRDWTFLC